MKGSPDTEDRSQKNNHLGSLKDRSNVVEVISRNIAILELIAGGASSHTIFDALSHFIESQGSDLMASILMLSQDGDRLNCVSAPSLPADYIRTVDGVPVGENRGSCGTAAFRGEAVYCNDLSTDKLWREYRHIAETFGLGSCWSTPVKDLDGEVLGTIAIYRSQTGAPTAPCQQIIELSTHIASLAMGRLRADEALRMSQQKFAMVFQNSPDAVMLTTLDEARIVEANQGCVRMFGFSQEQLVGNSLHELQLCTDPQHSTLMYQTLRQQNRVANIQFDFRTSRGEERTALISAEVILLHSIPHVVTVCRDITLQLEAEQKLQRSSERLVRAQQLGRIGDWTVDLSSGEIEWSEEMFRIYGRPGQHLTSEKVQSWVHEEHLPDVRAYLAKLRSLKPGEDSINLEYRIVRPNGEIRWVAVTAGAMFDPQDNMVELCGIALDVTARRAIEESSKQAAVATALVATLSPREKQVLSLVVDGLPNKAVATRLDIAEKTVEKHRANVMRKLQAHSLPELVRIAMVANAP